jgi:hypothetical protein
MTETGQFPVPAGDESMLGPDVAPGGRLRAAIGPLAAITAGTALLGIPAGLAWAAVAPRASLIMIGPGIAQVVNPETSAFIVADAWFCLLALAGGVIAGSLGYALVIRRLGAAALAGLLAGALAASLLALWIGQQAGSGTFHHRLATSAAGTYLDSSLTLTAHTALAFWPMFAGLTAGTIEMIRGAIERRRAEQAELSTV